MSVEVYLDVLFFINFGMDLAVLWSVSKITDTYAKLKRLILSAGVGAFLYCLIIYFFKYYLYGGIIGCIAILSLMILIAFKPKSVKAFLKLSAFTYLTAIVLGGVSFRLYGLFKQGYFSFTILILSTALTYLCIRFGIDYIDTYITKRQNYTTIDVFIESFRFTLTALIDTGNFLKDPLTGADVIVTEREAVADILKNECLQKRLRAVPFETINNSGGALLGIRSDYVIIKNKKTEGVVIGISEGKVSSGNFNAIIGPDLA